jgi:hypothetical protein
MEKEGACDGGEIFMRRGNISLLIGSDVFEQLEDLAFKKGWNNLYADCLWGTVFQSLDFVGVWYKTYKGVFLPIVIKSETNGVLDGLLTMALHSNDSNSNDTTLAKGRIVGAGHYDAEYQTWLAHKDMSDSFIKEAIFLIKNKFPKCSISFRFIPPSTPIHWIKTDKMLKPHLIIQEFTRPLMCMSSPELLKIFRKSEFRNKLNRLKRSGKLSFEKITNIAVFSSILPQLTLLYDFRQGAMFNKNQFSDDPLKRQLLLNMFEQGILHVTVLKVDEDLIASIAAVSGKEWVHLGGINIHNPFKADYYSPGFVHFLLLGQHLCKEGVKMFDLTPGGDSYKERMATDHDTVYELIVSNSATFKYKKLIRKQINCMLIRNGKRPMSMELALRKKKYILKNRIKSLSNPSVLKSVLRSYVNLFKPETNQIYSISSKVCRSTSSVAINHNSLTDLLKFSGAKSYQTRWEFLEQSMKKLEQGCSCYTWSTGDVLMACAWQISKPKIVCDDTLDPDNVAVLMISYYHEKVRSELKDFLCSIANEIITLKGTDHVYVSLKDDTLNRLLCADGFKLVSFPVSEL